MSIKNIGLGLLCILFFACSNNKDVAESRPDNNDPNKAIPDISYMVSHSYPHDTTSFTEGFLVYHGQLYESTGAPHDMPQTRSLFGIVDLTTGKINKKAELDRQKYFGEGIVFLHGKVYQLTYQTKIGFVYDAETFKRVGKFTIPSREGWGLTTDGMNIIMSDGTNNLSYIDPNTLQVIKTLSVSENGYAKDNLNELEYISGYIYANIWTTNYIVKIDPQNGNIVGKLDLTALADETKIKDPRALEMNGIAYDSTSHKIYVTGKLWPNIYEIQFTH